MRMKCNTQIPPQERYKLITVPLRNTVIDGPETLSWIVKYKVIEFLTPHTLATDMPLLA